MGVDLVHFVLTGAIEYAAFGMVKNHHGIVIFFLRDGHQCIDEFNVRGVNDRPADKTVSLVENDFTEQTVNFIVH